MDAATDLVTVSDNLSQTGLAKLAREVAMQIRELPDVLTSFGLTSTQYEQIKVIPFYRRTLELLTVEWNSALSGPERARLISAAILEEALPVLGARMCSTSENLNAAVETGKLFAKISGVGESKPVQGANERFVITINLGADQELRFEKDVTPVDAKKDNTLQLATEEP